MNILGGNSTPTEVLLEAGTRPGEPGALVIASGGALRMFTSDGDAVWSRRWAGSLRILGMWDFEGSGTRQILAASASLASTSLLLFDSTTGERLWTSPPVAGQMGGIKVADLGLGKPQIVWLPAANSVVRAWAFPDGVRHPRLMWETKLEGFVSDPYSFSALAVGRTGAGGERQIVIAGGRHSMPVLFLDAATGHESGRREYRGRARGEESGGERQLLRLTDANGTGERQIVSVSDHPPGRWLHVSRDDGDARRRGRS